MLFVHKENKNNNFIQKSFSFSQSPPPIRRLPQYKMNGSLMGLEQQDCEQLMTEPFEGLVHPKIKMCLCFTLPQSILGVYDFLLLDESNQSYIKILSWPLQSLQWGKWVLFFNSSEDTN